MPYALNQLHAKKRLRDSVCANGFPSYNARLPNVVVLFDGRKIKALVDTGCSRSIVSTAVVASSKKVVVNQHVMMMNGQSNVCKEAIVGNLCVDNVNVVVNCLVADLLPGYDMMLGMDVINLLGGVQVTQGGNVVVFGRHPNNACTDKMGEVSSHQKLYDNAIVASYSAESVAAVQIVDKDFSARFEDGRWIVSWEWLEKEQLPTLTSRIGEYAIDSTVRQQFDNEVEKWIQLGWLRPFKGQEDGLIPLMCVIQASKNKVRPVMDYRELNNFVSSHTATSEVCGEKLRSWRKLGENLSIIDLRNAYLQIHIEERLWKYQVVKFKGKRYCLTRLGFGLNVAPKIMAAIVKKVLSMDPIVESGTDSYVDDIVVNEDVVSCEQVNKLLSTFGLDAKPPERLNGGRILGLRVFSDLDGVMRWKRDNVINAISETMTKRQLFALSGQLVGHFPKAGWLRPACSYLKRLTNGLNWDDCVDDKVMGIVKQISERVREKDPVHGQWTVNNGTSGTVWCDASSLAIGVVLEINECVVEDASWLRKSDDAAHINLAELEAVIKGINLAIAWGLTNIVIVTDSTTVHGWISSVVSELKRVKTRGIGEALARRRLNLVHDIITECHLEVEIRLVKSAENKADELTRVPRKWLQQDPEKCCAVVGESIKTEHAAHHFGVDRTWFFGESTSSGRLCFAC